MNDYVSEKYGKYLHSLQSEIETVSVHIRLGGHNEPRPQVMATRHYPNATWYSNVLRTRLENMKMNPNISELILTQPEPSLSHLTFVVLT